jgi:hypothetical protein
LRSRLGARLRSSKLYRDHHPQHTPAAPLGSYCLQWRALAPAVSTFGRPRRRHSLAGRRYCPASPCRRAHRCATSRRCGGGSRWRPS